MTKSLKTTITFSYENKGVTLSFSLTDKDNAEKFISLLEQAIKDINTHYNV